MGNYDELFLGREDRRQDRQHQQLADEVYEDSARSRRHLGELNARLDRAELVNRALVDLLVRRGLITKEELSVLMQQVDLLDGVEDGKISSVIAEAPTCSTCGKFVNPRRKRCVYCHTPLSKENKKKAPIPTVACSSCGIVVPKSATYFGDQGVVCAGCFEL